MNDNNVYSMSSNECHLMIKWMYLLHYTNVNMLNIQSDMQQKKKIYKSWSIKIQAICETEIAHILLTNDPV